MNNFCLAEKMQKSNERCIPNFYSGSDLTISILLPLIWFLLFVILLATIKTFSEFNPPYTYASKHLVLLKCLLCCELDLIINEGFDISGASEGVGTGLT